MNSKTLMVDLEQGKGKLTDTDGTAEERRVSLVRSGWCSGRSWGRGRILTMAAAREGQGGARKKKKKRGGMGGNEKDPPVLFIKARG